MVATRFAEHIIGPDTHANRPAANAVPQGTIYSCTTHSKLYQSDGSSTWTDYFSDTGGSSYTPGGTDVAVADGGTGASTASGARTNLGLVIGTDVRAQGSGDPTRASLGLDTSDTPQFAGVEVGAASDTTLSRASAGVLQVEGNRIFAVGGADVPIADGGTGASTATAAFDALSPMTTQDDLIVGGASGTRTRLAKGSDGQVLTVDPTTHHLVWATPSGGGSALTVEEVDGSPTDSAVTKIVFPNGTLAIASHVATYTPAGGGGSSADYDVSPNPTVNDDEFKTTDTSDPMTGWTTLGTPTAHDINSTVASHYYLKGAANGSAGLIGIYKAIPSTPFTVTARLSDHSVRADYNGFGLAVMEASPGKIEDVQYQSDSGNRGVAVQNWTNRTTYNSTPVSTFIVSPTGPMYLRIIVNTTTSVDYYWSEDGLIWRPLILAHNPGFTIGAIGLIGHPLNGSTDVEAVFDWIRFGSSVVRPEATLWQNVGGGTTDPIFSTLGTPDTAFEFDSSSLTGLTAIGTLVAEDANTTVPSHYYAQNKQNGNPYIGGRYASVTAPFTAVCKVHANFSRNYHSAGLMLAAASPGHMELLLHGYMGGGIDGAVHVQHWGSNGGGVSQIYNGTAAQTGPIYLAIVAHAANNVDFLYSPDGKLWHPMLTGRDDSGNIATLGSIGVVTAAQETTYGSAAIFDFLRIWNSVKTLVGA